MLAIAHDLDAIQADIRERDDKIETLKSCLLDGPSEAIIDAAVAWHKQYYLPRFGKVGGASGPFMAETDLAECVQRFRTAHEITGVVKCGNCSQNIWRSEYAYPPVWRHSVGGGIGCALKAAPVDEPF